MDRYPWPRLPSVEAVLPAVCWVCIIPGGDSCSVVPGVIWYDAYHTKNGHTNNYNINSSKFRVCDDVMTKRKHQPAVLSLLERHDECSLSVSE